MSDAPFDSQNAAYAQLLYEEYARNPRAVPEEWKRFFDRGPEATVPAGLMVPEGLATNGARPGVTPTGAVAASHPAEVAPPPDATPIAEREDLRPLLAVVSRATSFVQAYRDHGHMLAEIDPLGVEPPGHPQLDPSFFGTSLEELEKIPAEVITEAEGAGSLADTLQRLKAAYCGHIGYEFEHLEDPTRVRWLWAQVESGVHTEPLDDGTKVQLLQRLTEVEGFEQYLHRAFLGQKRFSVEGNDMLIPMLDLALEEAGARGADRVVVGMAHRGRLNVLAHIVGIGYGDILREFEGVPAQGPLNIPGTGDVKYHHGAQGDYALPDGSSIEVVLAPNPSHLEFVNPVVMGMTRSMQLGEPGVRSVPDPSSVLPILMHGDAAFAAEGVVAETLNLGRLRGYTVGGTIHVIVNNQIGFTTSPVEGRSTRYASDLAKGYDIPVIHVNADRPEACLAAMRLAMAYRAEYNDDVVIDVVGYRRHGHNEGDEPAYTQPRLYEAISGHPTVRELWARRLQEDGVLDEDEAETMADDLAETLREAQDLIGDEEEEAADSPEDPSDERTLAAGAHPAEGEGLPTEEGGDADDGGEEGADDSELETGVSWELLERIHARALAWPEDFAVHPKLARQLDRRRERFGPDARVEWAQGELLAFGALLDEGFVIRLTGQDSERGTFSHRHMVLHDVENGAEFTPLDHLGEGRLEIYNSPLTEAAVVGYEYGYSVAARKDLVLWEAQFGDFVNAAQVAIDQFIAAGKAKWDQYANLTLLLPHGYEGQGPEHSSARLERFLQLCAEENMRVVYPTTPAQYFHLLRRQAHTRPESPLVVMTPKSLLRLPAASSHVSELTEGRFRPILDDPGADDPGADGTGADGSGADDRRGQISRLVLCAGKVYYDIQGHDRREEAGQVAVARLEQLYPFPSAALEALVDGYPHLEEVVWTQEEPRNMGGLTFVGPRLRAVVPRQIPLRYVARPERASPAEGSAKDHRRQQNRIVLEALGLEGAGD
jgi:2-oxoglutarate dehydrogenase E1 component